MLWKDIVGYEGMYMVSDDGQIMNVRKHILKPVILNGYNRINCHKDGILKSYLVHRLVAEAFIENPDNKEFVDHINGNRQDNRVENLRWATAQENCRNCSLYSNNTTGFKGVHFKKSSGKYGAGIRIDGKRHHIGYYDTAEEASEAYRQFASTAFGQFFKN